MATYKISNGKKTYSCKTDKATVVEADKKLSEYVGKHIFELIKVCERKRYSIEKTI